MASDRGYFEVVELLLAKGASVNQGAVAIQDYLAIDDYLCDERGYCFFSLHHSVSSLGAGCKEGITPLLRASIKGRLAVVEFLLAKGANVNQGAVSIHDYLCDEYFSNATVLYLRKQVATMAPLHSSGLPKLVTWWW
jgi:ankyrin repeat protein